MKTGSDLVTIPVMFRGDSKRSWGVLTEKSEVSGGFAVGSLKWFPKSQVELDFTQRHLNGKTEPIRLTAPRWLLEDRGIDLSKYAETDPEQNQSTETP